MTENDALLILNALPDLGALRICRLREVFGKANEIFRASAQELAGVDGIGKKAALSITRWEKFFDLGKEKKLMDKHGVRAVTVKDPEYPRLLKEIHDPPAVLYVAGNGFTRQDKNAVAVVGSRNASGYGISVARRFAKELSEKGFTVVSGMARGVDTAAHEGALSARGGTIAVWGSGIDVVYPPENRRLAEKIIAEGAVVTEFPFGTAPKKDNFPRRNRIISGLSAGVVVVEAGRFSGSLITARMAAEQGREVFCVPGRIDSDESCGANELIKCGAKPAAKVEDIIEELMV